MILADYLLQYLRLHGVGHVFGVPGGENITIIEALRKQGIDSILFSHEVETGYAADVTGQLSA